jgi:hypothetical protein
MLGQVRSGYFRLSGYVKLFQVRSGYFSIGQVNSGYFMLGQVGNFISVRFCFGKISSG